FLIHSLLFTNEPIVINMAKKNILPLLAALLLVSCNSKDEIDFAGTVVDYELCNSTSDLGYAVQLSAPDTLGGTYLTSDNIRYGNVIVIYGSDRMLGEGYKISGSIILDKNYSEAYCRYHYRTTRGDVPEARFSKLKVN
ncbi:MAG: hypothetical protein SPJ13_01720, partial [Bacteroidales bacterium]|nr:hypothetical protein [Bacteroidales bacterium]